MKRSKPTNIDSDDKLIKPCKKLKAGIASHDQSESKGSASKKVSNQSGGQTVDKTKRLLRRKKTPTKQDKSVASPDPSLSNGVPSKEVSNQCVGQTIGQTKRLILGRKTPAKQDESVALKRPRKKGELSADSRGPEALRGTGDLALTTTTPNTIKGECYSKDFPSPIVLGLQCKALTVPQNKKSKQLVSKSSEDLDEAEVPLSVVPFASKTIDNQETYGDTPAIRKWGRTFRRQPIKRKTSFSLNSQVGAPTLQQEQSKKPVKGKRERRHMVRLDIESLPQDLQASCGQIENGNLDIVDKSLVSVPENQPLSTCDVASLESASENPAETSNIPPSITTDNDQKPSFEQRSSFWETSKSMEAFRLFPQNPHFRPLDDLTESVRERHAIYKMVDYTTVFEAICRLHPDHSRDVIEDHLKTLSELETHGFVVASLRKRLMDMLCLKDTREALKAGSKEQQDSLEIERVKIGERKREIAMIDKQLDELRDKRDGFVKEKEKSKLKIVAWAATVVENEEAKRECDRKFCELATAPYLNCQQ